MTDPLAEGEISRLLHQVQSGDGAARDALFELINKRLRGLATGMMRSERADHTLQATALVNEACLKMMQQGVIETASDRLVLFRSAVASMKQVLIDHARSRATAKRGGELKRHPLDIVLERFEDKHQASFIELEAALERLKQHSERQHEVLSLRFFAGLTIAQVAEILECSTGTVESDWRLARAKIHSWLKTS